MCIRDSPMGGSHHHIGGSVDSHLPEIQQHAQSWTSTHVCGRPWAPVSEHIMSRYGVLPWLWPPSEAWLVDPMIGLSRHVKDLTSPHPHVMQQHPQVGGSGGLRTHRIRAVCGGLWEVYYCTHIHASPAVPCFMGAQWEVVCCMA